MGELAPKFEEKHSPLPPSRPRMPVCVMLWTTLRSHTTQAIRPCLRPTILKYYSPSLHRNGAPRTARFLSDKAQPTGVMPSFREQVARSSEPVSFSEKVKRPSIRNQIFFFLAGSYIAYGLAATKTNIDTEHWSKKISAMSSVWSNRSPSSDEMRRTQNFELGAKLQSYVGKIKEATLGFPILVKNNIFVAYVNIAQPYLNASEGRRTCWKIIALNTAVWVAWQIPRLQVVMRRSFTHHPLSGLSYTMLTSVFSHKSFLHLMFNCFALASFGSAATNWMIKEQFHSASGLQESTSTWHFLAFFVSAGLFSGLVSHIASTRIIFPRLISQISLSNAASKATTAAVTAASAATKTATKTGLSRPVMDILPSLGASGAIYAAVTLTALGFPDSDISLLFLPMFAFPIQWGVGALVLVDIAGIVRGWRTFDHYAHLGGAAFGVAYHVYGPAWWDSMRVRLARPKKSDE